MTNATCSIWGTPAFEYPSHGGGGHLMDSPRAGGNISFRARRRQCWRAAMILLKPVSRHGWLNSIASALSGRKFTARRSRKRAKGEA